MVLYRRGDRALRPLNALRAPQKVDNSNIPFVNPTTFQILPFLRHF